MIESEKFSNHIEDCIRDEVIELYKSAQSHVEQGQYAEAEPFLQRVLAIQEKVSESDHSILKKYAIPYQMNYSPHDHHLHPIQILQKLAVVYAKQAKYTQAEQCYQRILDIRKKALGLEHPAVAITLQDLAWAYKEQANYKQAESHLLQALAIWQKARKEEVLEMPDDPLQPSYPFRLRYFSLSQEEFDAQEAQRKVNKAAIEILQNLANIYLVQKKYDQAKQDLKDVLDIQEKTCPNDEIARTITFIADLDLEMNNFSKAIERYKQAQKIWKQIQISSLHNISWITNELELKIENAKNRRKLYDTNKELKTANENLEREQGRNAKLVQRYSHTLSNTIFPKTLYDIAERIKKNIELKQDALLLQEAYHAEISIILENELLQMRYSSSNPETFRQAVRKDRLPINDAEAHSIEDVLNYTLSRVIARLLNQNYAKIQKVRDTIITRTGKTLEALRRDFEEAVFLSDPSQSAREWCHNHLRPIELHYTSPLWQNIGIQRAGLAEAMLYGHFAEILFNAFKYADHSADWFLRITCGEWVENDILYLTICWENPLSTATPQGLGNGCGLAAIAEDLRQLNGTTTPETTLLMTNTVDSFKLCLHYQADLLRLPPKRNIGSMLLRNRQHSTT